MRGKPSWWDILVDDLDVAQRFYSAVFGWTFPISGPDFVVVFDGTEQVGQLYASSERVSGRGIRMYFDSDDLEGILAKVASAGGIVKTERTPIGRGGGWDGEVHGAERGPDRPPHQGPRKKAQQGPPTPGRRAGGWGGAENRPAPATTTGKPTDWRQAAL